MKHFQVTEGENQNEKEAGMASLFYWVNDWNEEQIEALKIILVHKECSPSLATKIINILLLR